MPITYGSSSFPYDRNPLEAYYQLILAGDSKPHGYVRPETVAKMPWTSSFRISHEHPRTVTVLDSSNGTNSAAAFTAAFQKLVDICIAQDTFRLMAKRHSEPFTLLSWPTRRSEGPEKGSAGVQRVTMERFAAPLFGILLQGAHMIAYVRSRATEDDCGVISGLWIPRRAKHLFSS
ncbi:hypothetical protein CHU98_g2758, partial [Xylaria longipes]